jgi:mono/diheme cytochrome c family protein
MSILLMLGLFACGGQAPAPKVEAAKVEAARPPAAAPAEAPAAPVGPDGPESIAIPAIASVSTDPAAITAGEAVFAARGCGACHKFGEKLVGPDLNGVLTRRSVPWVERMVTDPEAMTRQDPVAKGLFRTLMVQMTKQGVTPEELPQLVAYIHSKGG